MSLHPKYSRAEQLYVEYEQAKHSLKTTALIVTEQSAAVSYESNQYMSNEENMPERGSLLFPTDWYATIDGQWVSIYHKGHEGDDGELIFQSDSIEQRRPTAWYCSQATPEEMKILSKLLYQGWGYLLHV